MTVIIQNIDFDTNMDSLAIPTRPDGKHYLYEMIYNKDGTRLYDDTIIGFLTHLIPGYKDFNQEEKLKSRIQHAINIQINLQSQINLFFNNSHKTLEEEMILKNPNHLQPIVQGWSCQIPLVIIDAFYFPYSPTPRPYSEIEDIAIPSNLWWLRPAEGEMEYLLSLHELSLIDLNISKDEIL